MSDLDIERIRNIQTVERWIVQFRVGEAKVQSQLHNINLTRRLLIRPSMKSPEMVQEGRSG
jgi:hypothetical protein